MCGWVLMPRGEPDSSLPPVRVLGVEAKSVPNPNPPNSVIGHVSFCTTTIERKTGL